MKEESNNWEYYKLNVFLKNSEFTQAILDFLNCKLYRDTVEKLSDYDIKY